MEEGQMSKRKTRISQRTTDQNYSLTKQKKEVRVNMKTHKTNYLLSGGV